MNNLNLQKVADYFSLGKFSNLGILEGGLANQNYLATTAKDKKYVLRVFVVQTLEGFENELAICQQLQEKNILTASFLKTKDGKYFCEIEGHIITCSKLIAGKHPSSSTPGFSKRLGELLAKYHLAVTYLPYNLKGWLSKEETLRDTKQLPANEKTKKIVSFVKDNLDLFELDLPKGYIHGDFHFKNLVVTPKDEIAIFDFEECEYNFLILDVAKALSEVCVVKVSGKLSIDSDLKKNFLLGYESVRPVTNLEKDNLNKAIKLVCGASSSWLYLRGFLKYVEENLEVAKSLG